MRAHLMHRIVIAAVLLASGVTGSASPSFADPRPESVRAAHQSCGPKVSVDPESRTIPAEGATKPVRFAATVSARKGWHGVVKLSLKGLPPGASGTVTPKDLTFKGSEHGGKAAVSVVIGANPEHRRYQLWVVARCTNESALDGFRIEVRPDNDHRHLQIDPSEATVQPGDSTHYCVAGASKVADLDVTGLPRHTTSTFRPGDHDGCIWLKIATRRNTPVGDYTFAVTDHGRRGSRAHATAILRVVSDVSPFTITGDLDPPLELGVPQALDLALANPNAFPLQVTNIDVNVAGVDPEHRDGCPVAVNFQVTPFSGIYEQVIIPAHGTTSFSGLGIPRNAWPQIEWIITDFDQDGCIGAKLTLAFTGTAVRLRS